MAISDDHDYVIGLGLAVLRPQRLDTATLPSLRALWFSALLQTVHKR